MIVMKFGGSSVADAACMREVAALATEALANGPLVVLSATAKTTDMKFFAQADIELNQKTLKFQPCGWSDTLMGALTECLRNLRKFEYESPELPPESSEDGAQL